MVHVLENHPQRQKAIDLILAGESVRVIAAQLDPPVSFQAVQRYRKSIVRPVMAKSALLAKVLGKDVVHVNEGLAVDPIDHARAVTSEALRAAPILAVRESRLARLEDRSKRLDLVIQERAGDMAEVPGGKSGLLVRRLKSIGSGESAQVVEEYELDRTLLAEAREHEKQAAMELGQWQESTATAPTSLYVMAPAINITVQAQPLPQGGSVIETTAIDVSDTPTGCGRPLEISVK